MASTENEQPPTEAVKEPSPPSPVPTLPTPPIETPSASSSSSTSTSTSTTTSTTTSSPSPQVTQQATNASVPETPTRDSNSNGSEKVLASNSLLIPNNGVPIQWNFQNHHAPSSSSSSSNNNTHSNRGKESSQRFSLNTEILQQPQEDAAKLLGLSVPTFNKKWKEVNGKRRWPYRKHMAVEKKIKMLMDDHIGKQWDAKAAEKLKDLQEQRDTNLVDTYIWV